jgi:S-adenosyl-L-methionine hydrolase (adenosine-forming)
MSAYTITSDLGKENYLTAIVKGCIYEQNTQANIVEISSEVQAFDIFQASYLFKCAFSYFAKGSHHFILCGMYNTPHKNLLIAEYNGHYIYFLDNGFANLTLPADILIHSIKLDDNFVYNVGNVSKAFAMASNFIDKKVALHKFTNTYTLQYQPIDVNPVIRENELVAQVLFIDRFYNVVVNLTKTQFEEIKGNRNFTIEFVGREKITAISEGYNDVTEGKKVCFFNTAGYLEIAVRHGNAAQLFGFETGSVQGDDIYKQIKIFFNDQDS